MKCPLQLVVLLVLASAVSSVNANFLAEPNVQWTYRLPGSGTLSGRGLRPGNEVLVVPNNINSNDKEDNTVFVTADDGSLHLIRPDNLRESTVFEPTGITGTYTECRSGVTPVYDPEYGNLEYVVYAILDVPVNTGVLYDGVGYDPSRSTTLSRLLAVNVQDASLRWSVPLNGAVVGKPLINSKSDTLFVVHNGPSVNDGTVVPSQRGKVSVVLLRGVPVVTASLSPLPGNNRNIGPLGPPVATSITMQNGELNDVVVVAESWDNGYNGNAGNLYLLRPSELYEEFSGQGNDAYQLRQINDEASWAVSSVTKPLLKKDASEVFVGGMGARLAGWTAETDIVSVVSSSEQSIPPAWTLSLDPNKGNASQPLLVAPVLSSDQTVMYQVGASTEIHCIDTQTGDKLWTEDGALRTAILSEPRLVEILDEKPKLYVIEGMKGKVRQHNALTGTIDWVFDCVSVSGISCHDAVEADFSVAPSGNVIYYGDIFGKIVALETAEFSTLPPPPPTMKPTVKPTAKPTTKPTQTPTEQEIEEEEEVALGGKENQDDVEVEEVAENEVLDEENDTDNGNKTDSPTWAPTVESVPVLPPAPVRENNDDADLGSTSNSNANTGPGLVVDMQDETTIGSSAAMNTAAEDDSDTSFFANQIMIILVGVCGALAVAIIVLLVVQKVRNSKPSDTSKNTPVSQDDVKEWDDAQGEYEEECRRVEEETLQEIVGSNEMKTPTKGKRPPKKQKKMSPATPPTLASIEESPAECEISLIADKDAPKKNLAKSFDGALVEGTSKREKKEWSKAESQEVEWNKPIETKAFDPQINSVESSGASDTRSSFSAASSVKAELNSGEVVKSPTLPPTVQQHKESVRRTRSPETTMSDAANDLMSVDGSLYLDDDSFAQGKVEVASLSQFSLASSRDGNSQFSAQYSAGDGATERYMQPPRQASSPLLRPSLSPEVEDYLKRNQSTLNPNPMTPTGYIESGQRAMSTSPMTPSSDTERSREEGSSKFGRDVARAGQSVRSGGAGPNSAVTMGRGREPPASRTKLPPPQPPVKTEPDEPEDAWNSFLSELARAEREFFSPPASSTPVSSKPNQHGRAQSPPPPPPPATPPPQNPPDPPTANSGTRRMQL